MDLPYKAHEEHRQFSASSRIGSFKNSLSFLSITTTSFDVNDFRNIPPIMADSPFTGPGVFWISSNTSDEAVFPYADFVRWYEDVHILDVVHADPVQPLPVARRYQAAAADADKPFLVVYKLPTLTFVTSDAFRRIPLHHETLPEGGPIARFASFRGRFARHAETWVGRGDGAPGTLLLSEVLELGDGTSQDWYRDEYMPEVAALPGWQRSTRFEVVMENEIGGDKVPPPGGPAPPAPPTSTTAKPPRWLTLHEFDATKTEADLDADRVTSRATTSLLGTAQGTQRVETEARFVEVVPFHLVRIYGDAAAFADGNETGL